MTAPLTALHAAAQALLDQALTSPAEVARAYDAYADYFSKLPRRPAMPPPTSTDPRYDHVLLTLWDVIVDREEQCLDDGLIGPRTLYPTHDQLYETIFEELLQRAEAAGHPPNDPTATLESIAREIGVVTIHERRKDDDLPAAALEAIAELSSQTPGPAFLRGLDKLSAAYPRHLIVQSIVVQALPTPEAAVRHTAGWGTPIDIHRVGDVGEAGISVREYVFFERTCLTVYAARQDDEALLRSLSRLLALGQTSPEEDVPLAYFLGQHVQREIQAGRVVPTDWRPPVYDASLPYASSYLLDLWEALTEEMGAEFATLVAEEMPGPADLIVPQGRYQLKVTLRGIRPPIWRRLVVPAGIELARLHRVIQVAMGWQGGHLHMFVTALDNYGPTDHFDDGLYEPYEGLPLNILMQQVGHKINYDYDFGDGWEHEILLEKVLPEAQDNKGAGTQVQCLAGKRACPPEDCGGIGGYYALLEASAHPRRAQSTQYLEWNGGAFDAETFSTEVVNRQLARV